MKKTFDSVLPFGRGFRRLCGFSLEVPFWTWRFLGQVSYASLCMHADDLEEKLAEVQEALGKIEHAVAQKHLDPPKVGALFQYFEVTTVCVGIRSPSDKFSLCHLHLSIFLDADSLRSKPTRGSRLGFHNKYSSRTIMVVVSF